MDDAHSVQIGQDAGGSAPDLHQVLQRQSRSRIMAVAKAPVERRPLDVLDRDVEVSVKLEPTG
jgi:hypothetical protein